MDVYFFVFAKKLNSTEQPTIPLNPSANCQLKEGCSILHPVLKILNPSQSDYTALCQSNYAYLPDFYRYYFITNWTLDGAVAYCSMEVDVLATYKTAIMDTYQYVLRSGSAYDGDISDSMYPIKAAQPNVTVASVDNPLTPELGGTGCFVVGILNKEASTAGLDYYAMGAIVFREFCTKLFTLSTIWGADTSVVDGIKKSITDPSQYVISCIWLPYAPSDFYTWGIASATTTIYLGYDSMTVSGSAYRFDSGVLIAGNTSLVQLGVPTHPQASARGNFLNYAPYSRYYLSFYPFCGEIELDSSLVGNLTYLYLIYTVDLRTGKGILSVCRTYTGTGASDWKPAQIIRVLEAQIGVDIPLANIYTALPTSLGEVAVNVGVAVADKYGGFVETGKKIMSKVGDIISAGAMGTYGATIGMSNELAVGASEGIGATNYNVGDVSEVASNAAAYNSTVEITGSQGTMAITPRMPLQFWAVQYVVADDASGRNGRPLCRYRQLGGATPLSGYVCCDNPIIGNAPGATPSEVAEIENHLAKGCYIE